METKKWYSFAGSDPHNQGQVIDQATGHTVAVTYNDEEGKNARLIAASPDLLETLDGVMKALSRMIDKHDPDSIEAEWIGNAHEAILKATRP